MKSSKRDFLKLGLGGLVAGVATQASAMVCGGLTARQPEGPFYPERDQQDKDNDLTQVVGRGLVAEGEVILIHGQVQDQDCNPVEGALVEIWQACHTGKYNHSADPNTAELDPNFQYWGRAITDSDGNYDFKTIMPGAYPASRDWIRPSHIHCKVQKRGFIELTTQMYFKDSEHLDSDRLFLSVPEEERDTLVIDLKKQEDQEHRQGEFNVTIVKV